MKDFEALRLRRIEKGDGDDDDDDDGDDRDRGSAPTRRKVHTDGMQCY